MVLFSIGKIWRCHRAQRGTNGCNVSQYRVNKSWQLYWAHSFRYLLLYTRMRGDQRWDKHTNAAQNEWHLELAPEHLSPHAFLSSPPSHYWWTLTAHKSKSNFLMFIQPSTLWDRRDLCKNKTWKYRHVIKRLLLFPYLYSEYILMCMLEFRGRQLIWFHLLWENLVVNVFTTLKIH